MHIIHGGQTRHRAEGRKLTVELSGRPQEPQRRRRRTMSSRRRRPATGASRPAPTIVRGRPHRSYCARTAAAMQRTTARRRHHHRTPDCPCARLPQAKGLRLQLPALHDSQDESWMRTLTVKLRGRTGAPAIGAEGAQSLSARGDNPEALHGPLQRLLEVTLPPRRFISVNRRLQLAAAVAWEADRHVWGPDRSIRSSPGYSSPTWRGPWDPPGRSSMRCRCRRRSPSAS